MPNRRNYQRELDEVIASRGEGQFPRLLLHDCCAPCGSYTLEYLSEYFDITLFFYNPNISSESEYGYRLAEIKRLLNEMPLSRPVDLIEGEYEPERFLEAAAGLENEPEGGRRCDRCFRLRLEKTAALAGKLNFDYFTTTLSISPLKSAEKLNNIGEELAGVYGVKYLCSDLKKRGGYLRSIELSKQYNLYRQNYCGCVYSRQ